MLKFKKSILAISLIFILLLSACNGDSITNSSDASNALTVANQQHRRVAALHRRKT